MFCQNKKKTKMLVLWDTQKYNEQFWKPNTTTWHT